MCQSNCKNSNNQDKAQDPYVEKVRQMLKDRSDTGLRKYGVGLDRKDLSTQDWIQHAIEEALDLSLYLTRLKDEIKQYSKQIETEYTRTEVDQFASYNGVTLKFVSKPDTDSSQQCCQGCFFFDVEDSQCPEDNRGELVCDSDLSKIWKPMTVTKGE